MPEKKNWEYLGDGVYVSYDGLHIVLITGTPDNIENTIYLEWEVFDALTAFAQKVGGES
jgi:hypothetical protein